MTNDSPHNPDYSSRNRWLGPTPQILFWQIVGQCPLIDHFSNYYRPPVGPAKTVQTLRPLKEWAIAKNENRIKGDYAVLRKDQPQLGGKREVDLGFSISENMAAFGGEDYCRESCIQCPISSTHPSLTEPKNETNTRLASCCGILPETSSIHMHLWTRHLQGHTQPLPAPDWNDRNWIHLETPFKTTNSIRPFFDNLPSNDSALTVPKRNMSFWAWMMSQKELAPQTAFAIAKHLNKVDFDSQTEPADDRKNSSRQLYPQTAELQNSLLELREFLAACETAAKAGKSISLQAHPAGFSDGNDWWIGPHCGRCVGPMGFGQECCTHCGKESGPVPIRKRRIMGWAPYWPLHSISDYQQE